MTMQCPNHHKSPLEKTLFHNVEVDYCPECLGIWFDKDELAMAKDQKDEQLNWLDVDLWRDKGRFSVAQINRRCPVCRVPMVEVGYDHSKVKVDFCKHCQGVWLDRGEFKQIIMYLIRKYDYEILHHYMKNLVVQLWEVFAGPQQFREELEDFLMLSKLFNYKFVVQHPFLNSLIENSQK
jgi:Zn-finger nucleic acid-binding protein